MSKTANPIIVGLDIGTTKVVAIAGRKNEHGKLEILGFGQSESAGVKHGIVLNIEHCVSSIKAALSNCMDKYPNINIKDVYVGIAGHHIKSRQTRGDYVRSNIDDTITKEDVDMLISMQRKSLIPDGDEIIDIIPQDYIIDNTHITLEPVGMSGIKMGANFHVVTGAKNDIKNIRSCVNKSNLHTIDLVLQPLASAAAVMNPEDLEAGVAIVDIGGGTTDMAVFYDGILYHTAVIPFAGTNITEDIRQGLGVLATQAELMKKQFGSAIPDETQNNRFITIPGLRGMESKQISQKNLANIINARMVEIFEYVLYQLKQVQVEKKLHGGIILTGGGSQLNHVLQLCQFTTGLPARLGIPNEHLAGEYSDQLSNPMYSTCIGLILRGYADFENGKFDKDAVDYFKSSNEGDVIVKVSNSPAKEKYKASDIFEQDIKEELQTESQVKQANEKGKKSKEYLNNVFNNLKDKFLKIFEDDDDDDELK